MTATTVLTATVAPSGILISVRIRPAGEGISASTLSVEISNSGSSFSTASPVFFSHLVMVPSKMDSPICGITTSCADRGGADCGLRRLCSRAVRRTCGRGERACGAACDLRCGCHSPITATTVLTWTVSPSGTLISASTPATGEGISASTLSVEISKSGSSFSTARPAS